MDAAGATTIGDLPDDMLHEIFEHAYKAEKQVVVQPTAIRDRWEPVVKVNATSPPKGTHRTLRSVCRRWREIADKTRLATVKVVVDTEALAGRAPGRFLLTPIKELTVNALYDKNGWIILSRPHKLDASNALAGMVADGAALSRSLQDLTVQVCCPGSLVPTIAPIVTCTALTKLTLEWANHFADKRQLAADALAPLSSLTSLQELTLAYDWDSEDGPEFTLKPALPEVSRLTYLGLKSCTNFVPVGSDAALARLRCLDLSQDNPTTQACDQADPFFLRAAFEAGLWQPHRLPGLCQLNVFINLDMHPRLDEMVRFPVRRSAVGAEWAPLAAQVTDLTIKFRSPITDFPVSTGVIAGLGALTALRSLRIISDRRAQGSLTGIMRAPHLTSFYAYDTNHTLDLAAFPKLVHMFAMADERTHTPLYLRSLAGLHLLVHLTIGRVWRSRDFFENPPLRSTNLAELFDGGGGLPALKTLVMKNLKYTWETTNLVNVPTAEEFPARARQLLPSLVDVTIWTAQPEWNEPPPTPSEEACEEEVLPALRALAAGWRV